MRVHRVLMPGPLCAGDVLLRGDEAHHLATVLRAGPGAAVEVFDGEGTVADGVVEAVEGPRVRLHLGDPRPSPVEPARTVVLAVGLLKSDKLSDVVRAATEVGVAGFALVETEHADRTSLSRSKQVRLERIAREATKQSRRARVPWIEGPVPFERALAAGLERGSVAVAHPASEGATLRAAVEGAGAITVFTGPEGGFHEREVAAARAAGAAVGSLGPRILRAETAPVALAALALVEP